MTTITRIQVTRRHQHHHDGNDEPMATPKAIPYDTRRASDVARRIAATIKEGK